jgi:hypothetical protein
VRYGRRTLHVGQVGDVESVRSGLGQVAAARVLVEGDPLAMQQLQADAACLDLAGRSGSGDRRRKETPER